MDEITIGDKVYVSSKQAAKITGYAKDYVGQLCREGRVEARLVGRNWYVLESAIREHRFGSGSAAGEDLTDEKPTEETTERSSTWQKPQYEAETPSYVPPLAPKTPAQTGPAIADMQSAWKEWFEEKKVPQQALPDGSEDFKDEYLPVVTPERPIEAPHVEETQEVEVPIALIAREPYTQPLEAPEEVVSLHRSYDSISTGEHIPDSYVPVVDLSPRTKARRQKESLKRDSHDRSAVGSIRALLLVTALAVALVALVGTGNAEQLFAGTSLDFGVQKSIVDFLAGKSTYESSL